MIFLILMIFFVLFVFFKVPETKGKTFEEIAHQFAPGPDLEVEEMIDDEDGVFDDADDALPNDLGEQEDHRLVSFYLKGQTSQDSETPPGVVPPENIPLTNGAATQAMPIPAGVPFIDASPASERTNPSPSPLNPSKESLLAKTPEGDEGNG